MHPRFTRCPAATYTQAAKIDSVGKESRLKGEQLTMRTNALDESLKQTIVVGAGAGG